jgi:hypothetical protein
VKASYDKIVSPPPALSRAARAPTRRWRPSRPGSPHCQVPPQVAGGLVPRQSPLPTTGSTRPTSSPRTRVVRDERDGHRPLQVRRAREGLALGRQEESGLLGQGQALSRRLPRIVSSPLGRPGRGHPRRARPRLSSAASRPRSATASSRPSGPRSPCRKARGIVSPSWP